MKRGIITTAAIITKEIGGFGVKPGITAEDVRFYLMYWDLVVVPTNNIVHMELPDEDDLLKSGLVWRPRTQLTGDLHSGEIGDLIIKGQSKIANIFMKDGKNDWVIHQRGDQICLPETHSVTRNAIRVDLIGALPVPSKEIPINEVLEFKMRRSAELEALHASLDDIYFDVLNSPDQDLSRKKAFSNLQREIENLNRVANEKYKVTRKFDLTAELNFDGEAASKAAAAGAVFDMVSGFTLPIATVVSTIASLLKVKSTATKTLTNAGERAKFSYLSHASKEGVL